MSGAALAQAALALPGALFRLHGRDPRTGLDCVGVLSAALEAINRRPALPRAYALRCRSVPGVDRIAQTCGLQAAPNPIIAGDVLLFRVGPCQVHLAIAVGAARIVHAHARLRRVIEGPVPPEWTVLHHWRLADQG